MVTYAGLLCQRYDAADTGINHDPTAVLTDAIYILWYGKAPELGQVSRRPAFCQTYALWRDDAANDGRFQQWLTRIWDRTAISPRTMILALRLVFKLKQCRPDLPTPTGSHYRAFSTALSLAGVYDPLHLNNIVYWARMTGMDHGELQEMQQELLRHVHHNVFLTSSQRELWDVLLWRLHLLTWSVASTSTPLTTTMKDADLEFLYND